MLFSGVAGFLDYLGVDEWKTRAIVCRPG